MSDVKNTTRRLNKRNLFLFVALIVGFMVGYGLTAYVQANDTHAGFKATGIGEYNYVNMYKYNGMNETLGRSYFKFSSYVGEDVYYTYPATGWDDNRTIYLQAQVFINGNVYVGYITADTEYNTAITVQGVYLTIHYFEYKIPYNEFDGMLLFYCIIFGMLGAVSSTYCVANILEAVEEKREKRNEFM